MASFTSVSAGTTSSVAAEASSNSALRWKVVEQLDQLDEVRPAWLALREQATLQPPNADPDRFAVVTAHLGPDVSPYVAVLYDGDRPGAMLIGRKSRRRVAYRIGYVPIRSPRLWCLDIVYGGLLMDGSKGVAAAVAEHLETLRRGGTVEHMMLNHLPTVAPLAGQIRGLLASREPHHRFELAAGSYADTIARFSKKHRYNMRRADRLLAEHFGGDLVLAPVTDNRDIDAFLEAATEVTGRSYQGKMNIGITKSSRSLWGEMLRSEAQRGRLRCYLLMGGGRPIAHQLGCTYDGVYYLEATSFDPEYRALSPGQVLLTRVIEDLCAAGVSTIDYGFGDADYKRIYGTESWEEVTLHLYGRGVRATYAAQLERCARWASHTARSVLDRAGGVAGVKRFWRQRLARSSRDD